MQILGHARISVTLEIYTDSDSDSQRDALTRGSPETVETLVMRILLWPVLSLAL
jgi:nitrate reductase NapE component